LLENPYDRPFESSAEHRARYEYRIGLDCILPLLRAWDVEPKGLRVLDLGCGSGGLAVALAVSGARCSGIDLKADRIQEAVEMAARHGVNVDFQVGDVLQMLKPEGCFDLVVLSEVVEHLGTVRRVADLLAWCHEQLAPHGKIYVSFPPWYGPFAGHQAGWPGIRYIPWYHLLPTSAKKSLVPSQYAAYVQYVEGLNRLTIRAFERCTSSAGLTIVRRELYLLRPEYRFRYGVPQLRWSLLAAVPLLRELATSGAYYLLVGQ
jgi:2-polyprenyl-3-methyl-5-hydroxy-6-metoxy-1,4-benzoquinol methylase